MVRAAYQTPRLLWTALCARSTQPEFRILVLSEEHTMRAQLVGLSIIALLAFATVPGLALRPTSADVVDGLGVEDPKRKCCKICRKGKACGDSCIARDKKCHEPPGCACDE